MVPHYICDRVTLHAGDCLDVLRAIPGASVDAIVTDPPYGLAEHKPERIAAALAGWLAGDREQVPDGKGFMGRAWDGFVPPPAVWDECLRVLKPGGHVAVFAAPRTVDLMGLSIRLAGFEVRDAIGAGLLAWVQGQGFPKGKTQLKPAWEPILVARRPLEGTVAANVLAHGTGALNIDACRIGDSGGGTSCSNRDAAGRCLGHRNAGRSTSGETFHGADTAGGRWPANVVLDEHAAAELDQQSGHSKSPASFTPGASRKRSSMEGGVLGARGTVIGPGDEGGASRFFPVFRYQAKASTKERPKVDGVSHPTVKPLDLMRWLVRLVTPPGGTVLDPFAGSGTTIEAALQEGFHVIGVEREPDYLPLIVQRIQRATTPAQTAHDTPDGLFDLPA